MPASSDEGALPSPSTWFLPEALVRLNPLLSSSRPSPCRPKDTAWSACHCCALPTVELTAFFTQISRPLPASPYPPIPPPQQATDASQQHRPPSSLATGIKHLLQKAIDTSPPSSLRIPLSSLAYPACLPSTRTHLPPLHDLRKSNALCFYIRPLYRCSVDITLA